MRLFQITVLVCLLVPAVSAATESPLIGTWNSAPDETPLSSTFDESVWGKNAKSVRTVQLTVRQTGEATLTVTRKVVDARGRTVPASISIEHANLVIGPAQSSNDVRSDFTVTVKDAERRYPDDPGGTWKLEGLRVGVSTFPDKPGVIEVRVDVPEGRGSFWETLRRAPKPSTST
jgi:hypothetical protein